MKLEGGASPNSPFCEQTFALRASLALRLLGVLFQRAREERLLGEDRGDLIQPVEVLLVGKEVEPRRPECPSSSLIEEQCPRIGTRAKGRGGQSELPPTKKTPANHRHERHHRHDGEKAAYISRFFNDYEMAMA